MSAPLRIALVAGEESGDQLGAALMDGLRERARRPVAFSGVGGTRMAARGLHSEFPMSEVSITGITAIISGLPAIVRRVHQTVAAVIAADPAALVIIDSPEFTHAVAKRVRRRAPHIPILDYVSPQVWAWRAGRARRMRAYVDRVLAILPFEPQVHRRLGGPDCVYVGHPLIERAAGLRSGSGERAELGPGVTPTLLVLPGSRMSEVSRLMDVFGETLARLQQEGRSFEAVLPAVPHLRSEIEARASAWPVVPTLVEGEEAKWAAFRQAHAALAASGTVTLELALAGVPQVVAYRLDWVYRRLNRLRLRFPSLSGISTIVLANIVMGRNAVPEFIEAEANPAALAAALGPLLRSSAERDAQIAAYAGLWSAMALPDGAPPSLAAADAVLELAGERGRG